MAQATISNISNKGCSSNSRQFPAVPCTRSRVRCCVSQASSEFRLSKLAGSQTVSIDYSASSSHVAPASSGSFIPSLLGGIALCGVAVVALKKPIKNLAEKLPWSKLNRDLKMVESLNMESNGLSDELINAARARRSKESANHILNMEDIELPDNHPWATKRKVSREDEKNVTARLSLKRSLPPQSQQAPYPPRETEPGKLRQNRAGTDREQNGGRIRGQHR